MFASSKVVLFSKVMCKVSLVTISAPSDDLRGPVTDAQSPDSINAVDDLLVCLHRVHRALRHLQIPAKQGLISDRTSLQPSLLETWTKTTKQPNVILPNIETAVKVSRGQMPLLERCGSKRPALDRLGFFYLEERTKKEQVHKTKT